MRVVTPPTRLCTEPALEDLEALDKVGLPGLCVSSLAGKGKVIEQIGPVGPAPRLDRQRPEAPAPARPQAAQVREQPPRGDHPAGCLVRCPTGEDVGRSEGGFSGHREVFLRVPLRVPEGEAQVPDPANLGPAAPWRRRFNLPPGDGLERSDLDA